FKRLEYQWGVELRCQRFDQWRLFSVNVSSNPEYSTRSGRAVMVMGEFPTATNHPFHGDHNLDPWRRPRQFPSRNSDVGLWHGWFTAEFCSRSLYGAFWRGRQLS